MTTATVTKHTCARCGKKDIAERQTFSSFTRNRYCRDMTACDRRFKKQARA